MRADSLAGQVIAVLSHRTPAFRPLPGEPDTLAERLALLRPARSRQPTTRRSAHQADSDATGLAAKMPTVPSGATTEVRPGARLTPVRVGTLPARGAQQPVNRRVAAGSRIRPRPSAVSTHYTLPRGAFILALISFIGSLAMWLYAGPHEFTAGADRDRCGDIPCDLLPVSPTPDLTSPILGAEPRSTETPTSPDSDETEPVTPTFPCAAPKKAHGFSAAFIDPCTGAMITLNYPEITLDVPRYPAENGSQGQLWVFTRFLSNIQGPVLEGRLYPESQVQPDNSIEPTGSTWVKELDLYTMCQERGRLQILTYWLPPSAAPETVKWWSGNPVNTPAGAVQLDAVTVRTGDC